ncbi:MAG: YecA family protein [Halothiobacillaceae bacterium]|nr:YecA family protein [Halothiobacillaceae bacterium]
MSNIPAPITDLEVEELEAFLFAENVPEECMTLSEIDGFLTALAAGPVLIPPSEWLPVIWQGDGPVFETPQELERVLALILALNARIVETLKKGEIAPMFNIEMDEDDNELMTPDGWCWGFMQGVMLREEAWKPLIDSEDRELVDPIAMIAGGGREMPEFAEIQDSEEDYEEFLDLISGSALDIYDYWVEVGGKQDSAPKNLH